MFIVHKNVDILSYQIFPFKVECYDIMLVLHFLQGRMLLFCSINLENMLVYISMLVAHVGPHRMLLHGADAGSLVVVKTTGLEEGKLQYIYLGTDISIIDLAAVLHVIVIFLSVVFISLVPNCFIGIRSVQE